MKRRNTSPTQPVSHKRPLNSNGFKRLLQRRLNSFTVSEFSHDPFKSQVPLTAIFQNRVKKISHIRVEVIARIHAAALCIQRHARGWLTRLRTEQVLLDQAKFRVEVGTKTLYTDIMLAWLSSPSTKAAIDRISNWFKRKRFYLLIQRVLEVYRSLKGIREDNAKATLRQFLLNSLLKFRLHWALEARRLQRSLYRIRTRLALFSIARFWNLNNLTYRKLIMQIKRYKFKNRHHWITRSSRSNSLSSSISSPDTQTRHLVFAAIEDIYLESLPDHRPKPPIPCRNLKLLKKSYNIPDNSSTKVSELLVLEENPLPYKKPTYSSLAKETRSISRPSRTRYLFSTKPSLERPAFLAFKPVRTSQLLVNSRYMQSTQSATRKITPYLHTKAVLTKKPLANKMNTRTMVKAKAPQRAVHSTFPTVLPTEE